MGCSRHVNIDETVVNEIDENGQSSKPADSVAAVDNPVPTAEDINYLLDWINRYKRSGRKVTGQDIACAWSGYEIETDERNGEPSVYRGPNGIIMAYGCHLRDLSKTAKKAVHLITKKIATTGGAPLPEARRRAGQAETGISLSVHSPCIHGASVAKLSGRISSVDRR